MKIINDRESVLAIYIPRETPVEGIKFITPDNYSLQVGLIQHPGEKIIRPHIHRRVLSRVDTTQEFIYVQKGNDVKVTIFNFEWKEVDRVILFEGDAILFVAGGHSLVIPQGCRLIEVKQGPFPGEGKAKYYRDE